MTDRQLAVLDRLAERLASARAACLAARTGLIADAVRQHELDAGAARSAVDAVARGVPRPPDFAMAESRAELQDMGQEHIAALIAHVSGASSALGGAATPELKVLRRIERRLDAALREIEALRTSVRIAPPLDAP